nr:unnamed protein product [Callosobruchus chinensis]
MGTSEKWSSA